MGKRVAVGVGVGIVLAILSPELAWADWTATGTFNYQDREFDQNGFTGVTPSRPIRFAKVEVRDANASGGNAVLATGATDAAGNYSIFVPDMKTRTIQIRALTTSGVSNLFLQVNNILTPVNPYAVATAEFPNHSPTVNLNAGLFTAVIGAGGEPFNLYDVALNSVDYLAFLNGSRPGSSQPLTLQYQPGFGVVVNSYIGNNTVRVADNSGYNDTVIQHETGHYAVFNFSASDSPGGVHNLTNCKQDIRLAFDEGFATYFGQSVRRHFGLQNPHLYVKMTGAVGAGNLDFYFNVEDEVPFTCEGSTSEVTVYALLWDLADGPATVDFTPGADEFWDPLAAPDALTWDVMRNYLPSASNKSLEDFWDGWFVRNLGSANEVRTIFTRHKVEYLHDTGEANETTVTAFLLSTDGIPLHATYFKDLGNGAGTTDVDYFKFNTEAGKTYQIETLRLLSDANTSLVLLAPDGTTTLLSNDDRSALDKSSIIAFTASTASTFFIRSFHGPGLGIFGSYDIAVTGAVSTVGGNEPTLTRLKSTGVVRRHSYDGDTSGSGSGGSWLLLKDL